MEALAIDRVARLELMHEVMLLLILGPFTTMRDAASIAIFSGLVIAGMG